MSEELREEVLEEERDSAPEEPEDLDLLAQIESLKKQLEGQTARADENLRNWQRAQADFVNYKRRAEQEKTDLVRYANAVLVSKLLPLLDDFERASNTLPETLHRLSWIEGIFLIQLKFQALLQQEGVKPIDAAGKDFDPLLHEAVMVEPDIDLAQSQVVEELQRGYQMHDRVLRPTLVKVGKTVPAEPPAGEDTVEQPLE